MDEKLKKQRYDATTIQVLGGIEAVRKRPAMYIGDTSVRGLHHLVYEVVDNSVDEASGGYCDKIKVTVNSDGSVTVEDNGRGIPVDIHKTKKRPAVEVVLTTLHAGGKFDHRVYKVSGGLHGVGVSVVNALSEWLEAEIKRDGKVYHQRYERGSPKTNLKVIGKAKTTGTKITFRPDKDIFKEIQFSFDTLSLRLRELAFLNKNLDIELIDEATEKKANFKFKGGLVSFVEYLNRNKNALHKTISFINERDGIIIEGTLQYNDGYKENIFSFANNINTIEGGTHLTGFKTALTRSINQYAKAKNILKDISSISGEDTREGLCAVISVKVSNPQFEGQTKTKLGNSEVEGLTSSVVFEALTTFFEENPSVVRKIVEKAVLSARARDAARKARELTRRKGVLEASSLPGKLADCSEKDPAVCEVFIVEGESAGGCFSGDTKVALADGRNLSFRELVSEHKEGKENFCYTVKTSGKIGIEKILYPRLTKKNTQVIKVILDNNEEIICTPEHKFMLRDGTYIEAQNLQENMSLMPFKKKLSKIEGRITIAGYHMIFDPAVHRWIFSHLLSDRYNLEHSVYTEKEGTHKHHINFNKENNNPNNIIRMKEYKHLSLHRKHCKRILHRKDAIEKCNRKKREKQYREKISKKIKEKYGEKLRKKAKKQWENEGYKKFMLERYKEFYRQNAKYRERLKQRLLSMQKEYWSKKKNRKIQSIRTREFFQKYPERKNHLSLKARQQWENKDLLIWRREKTKEQWTDKFRKQRKEAYDRTYLLCSLSFMKEVLKKHGNIDHYDRERVAFKPKNPNLLKMNTLLNRFFVNDQQKLEEAVNNFNHKIKKIEYVGEKIDVYDIEVPNTHNFALASGIFVHNSAKQARDRNFQAILPIKGKIINVEKARLERVLNNEEVRTIIAALGTGISEDFDLGKLRYHKVIIMADADVDGSHIRTLLLTFFYRQLPILIEQGYIYIAQPPLYRIKRKALEEYIHTDKEMNDIILRVGTKTTKFSKMENKSSRLFTPKEFERIIMCLIEFEKLILVLERRGVSVKRYLEATSPKKKKKNKFPLYKITQHNKEIFAFDDEELASYGEADELDKIELFESYRIGEMEEELNKINISLREYIAAGKDVFVLENEETKQKKKMKSLKDVLEEVKKEATKGMNIQRYKGLGEMNPQQLWESTMAPQKRTLVKVTMEDAVEVERIFTLLMGEKPEPRRKFIQAHAHEVKNLDI
ncbi:MAG: DNA topoisomerase (ATP-hydrolyzing) subunit B [Candidatus Omnitrophota bacterium]|nr:MAG: DNA topoisomerase (ATP-hydrolyzing) subunit B [Candidatus Omnitrophota bacterium]